MSHNEVQTRPEKIRIRSKKSIPTMTINLPKELYKDFNAAIVKQMVTYIQRKGPTCPLCGQKWKKKPEAKIKKRIYLRKESKKFLATVGDRSLLLRTYVAMEVGICPICFSQR
jgi:hypothetical protein